MDVRQMLNQTTVDPLGDSLSELQLIQYCGNDKMILNAARVSYANDGDINAPINERDEVLIKYMLKNKHFSPFEHNLITFRVKAPLYVVQEMLRHRIGVSVNQQSARYVEPGKNEPKHWRKFYVPNKFRKQDTVNRQGSVGEIQDNFKDIRNKYIDICDCAFDYYEDLIKSGVCREQARGVLPHSTYTTLYYTLNLRSLMHFLELRLSKSAQWEIRQYAKHMSDIASKIFPVVFKTIDELKLFQYEEND